MSLTPLWQLIVIGPRKAGKHTVGTVSTRKRNYVDRETLGKRSSCLAELSSLGEVVDY